MKKILTYLAAVAATAILCGCNALSNIDVTDQKSVDELLLPCLKKHIDPQSTVYELMLGTTSDFSVKMDIVTVEFLEPGADKAKKYSITVVGNQAPREGRISELPSYDSKLGKFAKKEYTTENGIQLSKIDFSQIASNVAKASEVIAAEGHATDGVSSYTMTFDGDPASTVHKFDLLSKDNTKMGTQHGRAAVVTEYYEFPFKADAQGNVEYVGD